MREGELAAATTWTTLSDWQQGFFYMQASPGDFGQCSLSLSLVLYWSKEDRNKQGRKEMFYLTTH